MQVLQRSLQAPIEARAGASQRNLALSHTGPCDLSLSVRVLLRRKIEVFTALNLEGHPVASLRSPGTVAVASDRVRPGVLRAARRCVGPRERPCCASQAGSAVRLGRQTAA